INRHLLNGGPSTTPSRWRHMKAPALSCSRTHRRSFGPPREPHGAGRASLREFLDPQIGRPLRRVFALAAYTWPERVIAADVLYEDLGPGGPPLAADASAPIGMHRASAAA